MLDLERGQDLLVRQWRQRHLPDDHVGPAHRGHDGLAGALPPSPARRGSPGRAVGDPRPDRPASRRGPRPRSPSARSSRQSALTDPLPMSRPMARRFRKSLRPIALSMTYRPVQRSPDARVWQITCASEVSSIRMGSGKAERGAERPTGHAGLLPQSFHSLAARPLYPVRPPVGKPGGISSGCSAAVCRS